MRKLPPSVVLHLKRHARYVVIVASVALMPLILIAGCDEDGGRPTVPSGAAPVALFTATPSTGTIETEFAFDASWSSDAEDSLGALFVRWDWESDGVWDTADSVTEKTATHEYEEVGTKTITLQVRDTDGLVSTSTGKVNVTPLSGNTPPVPAFVVTPATGTTRTQFQFDASLSHDAEDPVTRLRVRWDWEADGLWDTEENVNKVESYTYSEPGVKTVLLEVEDTKRLKRVTARQVTVTASAARTWYVAADGTGDVPTIQAAMDTAVAGDEVLVGPGTYTWANQGSEGSSMVTLKPGVLLRSESGAEETILDAQGRGGVILCRGESEGSVIEGFTIRGGRGGDGAGIFCAGSAPHIEANIIAGNRHGIYCTSASPMVTGNTITGNSADRGAAVYCFSSRGRFLNNTITDNTATEYGGGVYCEGGNTAITGNTMERNQAKWGGGMAFVDASGTVAENTLANNATADGGGAVYCSASSPTIASNGISRNRSEYGGGGVYCAAGAAPPIMNNVLTENYADRGGAIFCSNSSSPRVEGNEVKDNSAIWGGAVYCVLSSPKLSGNIVEGNSAEYGGAISCERGAVMITENIIRANSASHDGGAIRCYGSSPGIASNTIVDNESVDGAAITCAQFSNPMISRNIIAGSIGGVALWCTGGSSPNISCNDFWNNAGGAANYPIDGGNISADPLFCDEAGGDYGIDVSSPCAPDNAPEGCGLIGALAAGCD